MGGAVSIAPSAAHGSVQQKLRNLLSNKKDMDKLFETIAKSGKAGGRVDKDYDISQVELLDYFVGRPDAKKNPNLRHFATNQYVVNAAFRHVMGKGKSASSGLTKKQFRILLPTLFLFSELWEIFQVADNNIDDKKIFKGEFLRAYNAFHNAGTDTTTPGQTDTAPIPFTPAIAHSTDEILPAQISAAENLLPTQASVTDTNVIPNNESKKPSISKDRRLSGFFVPPEITTAAWEEEFHKLDKDKNGYITFEEFCAYVVKNVVSPLDFLDTEAVEEDKQENSSNLLSGDFVISDTGVIKLASRPGSIGGETGDNVLHATGVAHTVSTSTSTIVTITPATATEGDAGVITLPSPRASPRASSEVQRPSINKGGSVGEGVSDSVATPAQQPTPVSNA